MATSSKRKQSTKRPAKRAVIKAASSKRAASKRAQYRFNKPDMTITVKTKENPHRADSKRGKVFAKLRNGMKVETFLAAAKVPNARWFLRAEVNDGHIRIA